MFEIEEDELYSACIKDIFRDEREADAKLHALTFIISNIPTDFPKIPGTSWYRAVLEGSPRVGIWFSFNGSKIKLHFAEIIETADYDYE